MAPVQLNWIANYLWGLASDACVVMPNPIHALIRLATTTRVGAPCMAPDAGAPRTRGTAGPIGTATGGERVPADKARVTIAIKPRQGTRGVPVWPRHGDDHIIRDDDALDYLRRDRVDHPAQWAHDPEHTPPAGGTR
jgi:hypothetical protein